MFEEWLKFMRSCGSRMYVVRVPQGNPTKVLDLNPNRIALGLFTSTRGAVQFSMGNLGVNSQALINAPVILSLLLHGPIVQQEVWYYQNFDPTIDLQLFETIGP